MFSLPEIFSEAVELPEGVEVLDRPDEVREGAFEYSEPYTDERGVYVPRQVSGVYKDAFESGEATEIVEALNLWHKQESYCSCAVVCSEMELNRQLDVAVTEADLCQEGVRGGWFDAELGTAPADIGKYGAAHGLKAENYHARLSLEEIRDLKAHGVGAIVSVDQLLLSRPDLPKRCIVNHVVEIIGFDYSNQKKPLVIINDPGSSHGRGVAYEMDTFAKAAGANFTGDTLSFVTTLRR